MAHSDVVIDDPAKPQPVDRLDDPLRRQIILIVISGCDPKPMRRHHRVVQREDASGPVARDIVDPQRCRRRRRKQRAGRTIITRRHHADKHPVDPRGIDPVGFARQQEPAVQRIEIQADPGIDPAPGRIIPQSHIPAARRTRRVTALDRQRRSIDRVQRRQPGRSPAKAKHATRVIARSFPRMRRMGIPVLTAPDQSDQVIGAQEAGLDRQSMSVGARHHAGHRPAREIDRPVKRIEAFHDVLLDRRVARGQPMPHR